MPAEREAPLQNGYVCSQNACPWPSTALNWWASSSSGIMLYTMVVFIWIGILVHLPCSLTQQLDAMSHPSPGRPWRRREQ